MITTRSLWFLRAYGIAVFAFLYLPIAMLVLLSFNDSMAMTLPWGGFTLRWYWALAENQSLFVSLKNSVILGLTTAALATVIGCMAALAFRNQFRGQVALMASSCFPLSFQG